MKICLVVEYLSYVGGGERVYTNWANMFSRILNYEVEIVAIEDGEATSFAVDEKVKITSLRRRKKEFYKRTTGRKLEMILNYFQDRKSISNYIEENQFDIVIGVATNINLILSTINISGVKIASEHNEYYAPNKFVRFIRSLLYNRFDLLTVLNETDKVLFEKINKNTRVLINPVNLSTNPPALLSSKNLISVASLSEKKNQKQMLDILKIIISKYPDWTLTIYGEGPLRTQLEEYAVKIGVSDNLNLPGVISDVYSVMSEASIFLLTSTVEGFGLVVVEAMSSGLPCVCFDAYGPSMLIEDGTNGFLIDMGDINDFAQKTIMLIENENRRKEVGQSAILAVDKYRIDNIADKWDVLFNDLINTNY